MKWARFSWWIWRTSPDWWRRANIPSPVPHADFVTTTTHKTLRGPRAGLILCKSQFADAIDKAIMPGIQGGPLMHVIAAKAVCFKEALEPGFKDYQHQIRNNATALGRRPNRRRFAIGDGRNR